MKERTSLHRLHAMAESHGLIVRREYGGFRLVKDDGFRSDVYPAEGICRTAPARELMIFLQGAEWHRSYLRSIVRIVAS